MGIGKNLAGFLQQQVLMLGIALRHMIEIEHGHSSIPCQHGCLGCGHVSRFRSEDSISLQKCCLTDETMGASRHPAELGKIPRIADVDKLFTRFLRAEDIIRVDELSTGTPQAFPGQEPATFRAIRNAETRRCVG